MSANQSAFSELVDVLVSERDLVALIYAFFDESCGDDGTLCVAGYIFRKSKIKEFERRWRRAVLNRRGVPIPFFRMSACAHGNRPFDGLAKEDRVERATAAIKIIRETADSGIGVTVNEREYDQMVGPIEDYGFGAYEMACWLCLLGVRRWMTLKRWKGKAAYFFEAGHVHQRKTNRLIDNLVSDPTTRERYRYMEHAFVAKEQSPPVQAADLVAWQWLKDRKNKSEGRLRRRDCTALLEGDFSHAFLHIDANEHAEFVRRNMEEVRAEYEEARKALPAKVAAKLRRRLDRDA